MRFEITHHLPVPPEKVFEYAIDIDRLADRVQGIVSCEKLTDGPVGLGTRFREKRIMFKREATETMEFYVFDPPRAYSVSADSHGCRYLTEFTFTAAGDGTDVHVAFQAEPYKLGSKILGFIFRPMMKRCMHEIAKDLDDLARAIEAEEGAAAS